MPSDRDLRAAAEALADEWETVASSGTAWDKGYLSAAEDLTSRLRAILAEHPATSGECDCGQPAWMHDRADCATTPAEPDAGGEGEFWHELPDDVTYPEVRSAEVPDAGGEGLAEAEAATLVDAFRSSTRNPEHLAFLATPAVARIVADRERVLRDRIAELEASGRRQMVDVCALSEERRERAEAAEALAAERGERLAAVGALEQEWAEHPDWTQFQGDAARNLRAALGPEAADLLADRERRAEARGAERALREFVQWVATQRAYNGSDHQHGQSLYNECINAALPIWAEEFRVDRIAGEGQ